MRPYHDHRDGFEVLMAVVVLVLVIALSIGLALYVTGDLP